jgi:hypothetical protein
MESGLGAGLFGAGESECFCRAERQARQGHPRPTTQPAEVGDPRTSPAPESAGVAAGDARRSDRSPNRSLIAYMRNTPAGNWGLP